MVVLLQVLVVLNFDVTTIQGVLLVGLAAIAARAFSFLFLAWVAYSKPAWLIDPKKKSAPEC
jgi:Na+-driven multidrug efflux pump